jgi:hypothetical protein
VVHGADPAFRADGARVRQVAFEPRRTHERDESVGGACDLFQRLPGRPDESGSEQEILGRIARDRELGEDDEIGVRLACPVEARKDLLAVTLEVADDAVDLRERDSQGFRLTVTNRILTSLRPCRSSCRADTEDR